MESQYNSFIQELMKIRESKAATYENSMLYYKEIAFFLNELLLLRERYANVSNNINIIKEKYDTNNYPKIFTYIDDAKSEANNLIENINMIEKNIREASLTNYNAMENEFIRLYNDAENDLKSASINIDNYNQLTNELKILNTKDPNYNNNFTMIDKNRDQNAEQANNCLLSARNKIIALNELLEKGLKAV